MNIEILYSKAVCLLQELIATPSFSREEEAVVHIMSQCMQEHEIPYQKIKNNLYAFNRHFDIKKQTLLLNSHLDTVKPNNGYTKNPFVPTIENDKLYGLGSNDAGGCLVSLWATFLYFYTMKDLKYNLCFAATAEEEISGANGMELFIRECPQYRFGGHTEDFAIIGEPTNMQLAIAEKGLMVVDATVHGVSGHAARDEGKNAIYKAMTDINWIQSYKFDKVSPFLGPVKMSVTSIETPNKAHNVVPDLCHYIIDIRTNELYSFDDILGIIRSHIQGDIQPRSQRLKSSLISPEHIIVKSGIEIGKTVYGSPTLSDKSLVGIPALKMGPGDSARSHTPDEFIYLSEIRDGIQDYINLISKIL